MKINSRTVELCGLAALNLIYTCYGDNKEGREKHEELADRRQEIPIGACVLTPDGVLTGPVDDVGFWIDALSTYLENDRGGRFLKNNDPRYTVAHRRDK